MEYLIQQFLKENNLIGINGINYTLRDDGEGVYIDKWTYNIPKPTFIQEDFNDASLAEAKSAKISQLQSAKNIALYAPVEYLETSFISSEKASQNILGALVLNGDNNHWLDVEGNLIILSKAQLQSLGVLIKNQRGLVYLREATLTAEINACTTLEEVEAININFE